MKHAELLDYQTMCNISALIELVVIALIGGGLYALIGLWEKHMSTAKCHVCGEAIELKQVDGNMYWAHTQPGHHDHSATPGPMPTQSMFSQWLQPGKGK